MNSKLFLICATSFFCHIDAVTIVIVRGTSCAGKSSLCKEFVRLNNSWKLVDEDTLYFEHKKSYWQSLFPNQYAYIEKAIEKYNIFHAIAGYPIIFKEFANQEEKYQAIHAIDFITQKLIQKADNQLINQGYADSFVNHIYAQIIMHAIQGFNIIVDSWFLQKKHINELSQIHHVKFVLAYCPLKKMIERNHQRNSNAMAQKNLMPMRFFRYPLKNYFTDLYRLKTKQEIDALSVIPIDAISKPEIYHAWGLIKYYISHYKQRPETFEKEHTVDELHTLMNLILNQFGLDEALYIVPKNNYDHVIYSDNATPQECAQQILDFCK